MSVWTIVPVKPLKRAKSRLAEVLSPAERMELAEKLLRHTLATVQQVPEITGTLVISRAGYEVIPDMKTPPDNAVPVFKGHPQGGPQREAVTPEPWIAPLKAPGSSDEQFNLHVRNFLDCIKSRQRTVADVEDGHHTAIACHLANISLRTGRKIRWDAKKEEIIGDAEASRMLERPYRKPWDNVLKGLLA